MGVEGGCQSLATLPVCPSLPVAPGGPSDSPSTSGGAGNSLTFIHTRTDLVYTHVLLLCKHCRIVLYKYMFSHSDYKKIQKLDVSLPFSLTENMCVFLPELPVNKAIESISY